ncbi:hypothetical protein [Psychrobacter piscatorii]|uniref:hypothetical protein n=1 Tax=Psychrobacter piscatorii TaxID=554343 RepID=UPI00191A4F9A|nr:hypothetical protein [Psychrobacter piscatorii]
MHNDSYSEKINNSEFILLTGDGKNGLNHLRYWVPEFIKAQVKFSILVRNTELLRLVQREYRLVNILFAKSALDIEATLTKLTDLKAIFFMSNPANNIHVLRFNKYKHIFLGSENSDRDAQVTKVLRAYDELWLSSQSSIDKLKSKINVESLIIRKIGKPQFRRVQDSIDKKNQKTALLLISSQKNVYSNSNILTQLVGNFPRGYNIKVVLEQSLDNKNILFKNLKAQLDEFVLINKINCYIYDNFNRDLLLDVDYLICDINNYKQEFLAENALICMYTPDSINLEAMFENKYISFDGISKFSTEKDLQCIFSEYENLYRRQKDFSEYWIGNSYIENSELTKNLQKLSAN